MSKTFWTDERIDIAKDLWNKGKSGSEIAEILGCNRNMVTGAMTRLFGDASRSKSQQPAPPRKFSWEN